MLRLEITSWSGFPEAPVVVQLDDPEPNEMQVDTPRPTLRLIEGEKPD